MPRTKDGKPILYKPWKNTTSSKNKMWVYVKNKKTGNPKKIGFGLKGMQDFTQHRDPVRRKSYLARAKGIRDKQGNLTWKDKNSANYWSIRVLWNGP
jgi:hypothetical protein